MSYAKFLGFFVIFTARQHWCAERCNW